MNRYENPWRPNFEAVGVGLWLAVALIAWATAGLWDLHAAPFRYLALSALAMAVLWLPGMLRVWRRHHRLCGKPLAFIAPTALERQVGPGSDLWLGWGFDWTGGHAQLVHDLLRTGPARLTGKTPARLGADWIHGLGERERTVRLPLVHTEGHLLVVGTTGAGKAQPLTARVHTPVGWRAMEDLQVGDTVSTPDGGSARITGVFPQGSIPIHRVRFVDGRVVEACGAHLWEVHHKHWNGKYRPGVSRAGAARPRIL